MTSETHFSGYSAISNFARWDAQVSFPVPISSGGGCFEKNGRQITILAGKIWKLVYLILRQSGNVWKIAGAISEKFLKSGTPYYTQVQYLLTLVMPSFEHYNQNNNINKQRINTLDNETDKFTRKYTVTNRSMSIITLHFLVLLLLTYVFLDINLSTSIRKG